jgi:arginine N-succinyltransferase
MSTPWQLRSARPDDLPALRALLPLADPENLLLEDSPDETLLLALPLGADNQPQELRGCIRITRQVGLTQPRYWYHLGCVVHAATELGLFRRERRLLLGNDFTGATELSDIAGDAATLPLLLRAALLLLLRDQSTAAPAPRVIAQLPGPRDSSGAAPFWLGLGRHFCPLEVASLQARGGNQWLTQVAALLPRHPLVVSLLHADAQRAVGEVDTGASALHEGLLTLGLRQGEHVSVYDAGPVMEAGLDQLARMNHLQQRQIRVRAQLQTPQPFFLAAATGAQCWPISAEYDADGALAITPLTAQHVAAAEGERRWIAPL